MSRTAAAAFFQALGDETRLALLLQLAGGERPVGDLVAAIGCPQPKISRHLKVLKDAGLVRDRRDGRRVLYSRTPRATWPAAAREWIDRLSGGSAPPSPATPKPEEDPAPPPARRVRRVRRDDLETHLL